MNNSTLQNVANSNLLQLIIFILGFGVETLILGFSGTLLFLTILHISLAVYLRTQLLVCSWS